MDILKNVPLGLYLETPRTWLHRLDPRVKLIWLLSILLSPILANSIWRLLLIGGLVLLTFVAAVPMRVWVRQLSFVLFFSVLTFLLALPAPDALGVDPQPQRQGSQVIAYGLIGIPQEVAKATPPSPNDLLLQDWQQLPPAQNYRYQLFSDTILGLGPFTVTRRSLSLAIRLGTLIFTLLYSTTLFLLTTAPEEVTEGLQRLSQPLKRLRVPVEEIVLTLTLALRFLPLVLEEVQNLSRAVRTRDIRWQALSLRGAIHMILGLVERLLENLLLRAEQTAAAMQVRGYTDPTYGLRWHMLRLRSADWFLLGLLPIFWAVRLVFFTFF